MVSVVNASSLPGLSQKTLLFYPYLFKSANCKEKAGTVIRPVLYKDWLIKKRIA